MMTLTEIEQAVVAAGFAVHEAHEYADGVKLIVSKSETYIESRQYHFGSYYREVTAPTWFSVVGILHTATADEIADSLDRWWKEDK